VISPIAAAVQRYLPWVTVVLGCALVAGGVWLLAGRSLPAFGWSPRGPKISRNTPSMVAFGAAYAAASLTCTIAPFLAVVVASFRASSVFEGSALFVAYALGIGIVVGIAAVAVALAKSLLISGIRSAGRFLPAVAGILMVCVGAYVAYYGLWEIRVLSGESAADPVIEGAAVVQQLISSGVAAAAGWLVVALPAVLGVGGILAWRHHFKRRRRAEAGSRST
jgi:cytochrome c-type biogenesis protein